MKRNNNSFREVYLYGLRAAFLPRTAKADLNELPPEEIALADSIKSPSRKEEFLRGRWLCHNISDLTAPILKHPEGDPAWPPGWIGSISHVKGHLLAACAQGIKPQSIGVDIEMVNRLHDNLAPRIATAKDLVVLECLKSSGFTPEECLALVFSAKEAFYKTVFPLHREVFTFTDVEIRACDIKSCEIELGFQRDCSVKGHEEISGLRGGFKLMEESGEKLILCGFRV